MSAQKTQRGDTLIEVLFAFSIFALVAVGALAIMNRGSATAQRSLEITLVRAQMDAQAEAIRYIHQAYVAGYQSGATPPAGTTAAEWIKMTNVTTGKGVATASPFGQINGSSCLSTIAGKPFILNARTAKMASSPPLANPGAGSTLPPYSQVVYNADSSINQAYGIWVEAVPSVADPAQGGSTFVDFHIRSCWSSVGGAVPVTLGTIVRLYEPR